MGVKELLEGEVVKLAAIALVGIIGLSAITVVLPIAIVTIPLWLLLIAGYWYIKE